MAKTLLSRSGLPRVVLGLAVLSLVFLGSPGCGCGDDDLDRGGDRPDQCCCQFEWMPGTNLFDVDVRLVIENADASLDPSVTPALLTGVSGGAIQLFTICVNDDHTLLDAFDLVFVDEDTNVEYGRVQLIYRTRCEPEIEVLSGGIELISIDCGSPPPQQCCCEFQWLPPTFTPASVNLTLQNVSASLNPTILPSTLNNVQPGVVQNFTICIDDDHTLLDSLDLVITENGGGGLELGRARITYRLRCTPELSDITDAAHLELGSEECGPPLECCCDFEWVVPSNAFGDVQFAAQGASAGLSVSITPSVFQDVEQQGVIPFRVCVNADHNLLDEFTLVATTMPGGAELGRMQFVYREQCSPDVFDIPDFVGLALISVSCGQTQCCCTLQLTTDPEFWDTADITLTLENVGATLVPATIFPDTFTGLTTDESFQFDVCVNSAHNVDETMEIVITETGTTNEITRIPLTYDPTCVANPGQDTNALVSVQNLGCDVLEPVGLNR